MRWSLRLIDIIMTNPGTGGGRTRKILALTSVLILDLTLVLVNIL